MEQIAWSALGLLAVAVFGMFGVFFYLGARIDGLSDSLGRRMDRLDARLDSLGTALQSHVERHPW